MDRRRPKLDDEVARLPIKDILPQVRNNLAECQNLVLQAQTGAGKTTIVPLEFLRWGLCQGRILVLQPRRIAAIGVARRMAELWGEPLGETVGYRIRHDSACGPRTRIEVITEGILVRMLHANRALTGVSCVFFDEFHERSLDSDMSFALSLCAQREWNKDLRLIIMSATLASLGEQVARLLGGCPQIFSEGRMFPVEVRHVGWMEEMQTQEAVRVHKLEETTAEIVRDALLERDGDILVFLPGEKEIMYTWIFLNNNHGIGDGKIPRTMVGYGQSQVKHGVADLSRKISVMPLYGNLDQEEQDDVLSPAQSGGRKVILATSIAESSITVPGIRIVIDSGLRRVREFVSSSNTSYMKTVQVSKGSADQRKGRAGRVAEGICYRMWHEYEHRHMDDKDKPEIVKEDLTNCVLDLAVIGVCSDEEMASLPWVDLPPSNLVTHARNLLVRLRALHVTPDGQWSLLPRGRHLARLPLHPRASHLVLQMRAKFGKTFVREACNLAALLDEKDPLRGGRKQHGVDLSARYEAVYGGAEDLLRNVRDRVLNASAQMQYMLGLHTDNGVMTEMLDKRVIGLMVAWAFPELLAEKVSSRVERPKGRAPMISFKLINGSVAKLDAFDKLGRSDWLAVASVDGEKILWACELDPDFCLQHGYDVKDPFSHEVFKADFAADIGEQWSAPSSFVRVQQIDFQERRVDPLSGKATTFQELEISCKGTYSAAEIRSYWFNECSSAQASADTSQCPNTGTNHMAPSRQSAFPGTSETESCGSGNERRVNPEDGRSYTLAQLKLICASAYTEREIEDYWMTICHPLKMRSIAELVLARGSIGEWLLDIDDHGTLSRYEDVFRKYYQTAPQILNNYMQVAGSSPHIKPSFFEDFGIKKLGHRRMFERWLIEHVT